MADNKVIKLQGTVEEALPSLLFRVSVKMPDDSEREVLAHLAGKMKMYRIRVVPGDTVTVEMPNENSERGRIIRRL
ncbi:MAG: translation initiation factor IF-1 [Candidatus Paceibacterota bacterium]